MSKPMLVIACTIWLTLFCFISSNSYGVGAFQRFCERHMITQEDPWPYVDWSVSVLTETYKTTDPKFRPKLKLEIEYRLKNILLSAHDLEKLQIALREVQ